MSRFFTRLVMVLFFAATLAGGLALLRGGNQGYVVQELWSRQKWARYDDLIKKIGLKHQVDPMLIKAVVWQESRFGAKKIGLAGERGLMQITEPAAADWAKANGVEDFDPDKLLIPEINLDVGTWYLKRGLDHYKGKDSPIPFALSEYNAGRTRVKRWTTQPEDSGKPMSAEKMKAKSFESTRSYVESIEQRYHFYQKRGYL